MPVALPPYRPSAQSSRDPTPRPGFLAAPSAFSSGPQQGKVKGSGMAGRPIWPEIQDFLEVSVLFFWGRRNLVKSGDVQMGLVLEPNNMCFVLGRANDPS